MIELYEMPRDRFPAYQDDLAREYARDNVRAGVWSSEGAPRKAAEDTDGFLPDGTDTEGHYLYLMRVPTRGDDIEIYKRFRRKGYATQALQAVEQRAIELGANSVGLQIFGHNPGARALYERGGYVTTSAIMAKRLNG